MRWKRNNFFFPFFCSFLDYYISFPVVDIFRDNASYVYGVGKKESKSHNLCYFIFLKKFTRRDLVENSGIRNRECEKSTESFGVKCKFYDAGSPSHFKRSKVKRKNDRPKIKKPNLTSSWSIFTKSNLVRCLFL